MWITASYKQISGAYLLSIHVHVHVCAEIQYVYMYIREFLGGGSPRVPPLLCIILTCMYMHMCMYMYNVCVHVHVMNMSVCVGARYTQDGNYGLGVWVEGKSLTLLSSANCGYTQLDEENSYICTCTCRYLVYSEPSPHSPLSECVHTCMHMYMYMCIYMYMQCSIIHVP